MAQQSAEPDAPPVEAAADEVQEPRPGLLARWRQTGVWIVGERYMVAHIMAWPMGFIASAMAMPYAFMIKGDEILGAGATGAQSEIFQEIAREQGLDATMAAAMEITTIFMLWAGAAVMVVPHVVGLPWAITQARSGLDKAVKQRSTRRFWIANGLTMALVLLAGLGGYAWFFVTLPP